MNRCIIGIGSNIDAKENISKSLILLQERANILAVSTMVETIPIGITNQAMFTNGAVLIETDLSKETLRILLKQIEDQCGRDRTAPKFGPRTIDLDIVIWNNEVVDEDYHARDFLKNSCRELGFEV